MKPDRYQKNITDDRYQESIINSIQQLVNNSKYLYRLQKDTSRPPKVLYVFDKITGDHKPYEFEYYKVVEPQLKEILSDECSYIKESYLIFGKIYQYEQFKSKLYEGINKIYELICYVNKCIKELNIDKEIFHKLELVNNTAKEVISILKVEYSDNKDKNIFNITKLLDEIKVKLNLIIRFSLSFKKKAESNGILDMINEIHPEDKRLIFNSKYNIPIPSNAKTHIDKSIFASLKNCDFLSIPFLSNENNSITCCFQSLNCAIGPIIPSLYSDNLSLNFVSFIDQKISIKVQAKDEKYNQYFNSKIDNLKNNSKVYISLPNTTSNKPEVFDIETNIIISSNGLNSLVIPSTFHMNIVPLIIYFSCDEYKISYIDKKVYLCTNKLLSGSKLKFSIKNYNINETLYYRIQFESLENNNSPQPKATIDHQENRMIFCIPKVEKPTRLHCAVNIKFSENTSITLIIDSVIIPFDFSLYLYNYNYKKYVENVPFVCFLRQNQINEITLNLRVSSNCFDLFKDNTNYFTKSIFRKNLPNEITDISIDPDISFDYRFIKNTDFKIKFKIDKLYNHFQNENYFISLRMNEVEKKINLSFDYKTQILDQEGEIISDNILKSDLTSGLLQNKLWEPIKNISNLSNYFAICTPFDSKLYKQTKIQYNDDCSIINSKDNLFVYINKYYKIEIKNQTKSETKNGLIPIIGISNNNWYPVINNYHGSFENWDYLITNTENIFQCSKRFSSLSIFPKKNDFNKLARMMDSMDPFYLYNEIENNSELSCFKNIFEGFPNEMDLINGNAKQNDLKIIKHNLIVLLYKKFKAKFDEIQKRDNYLVAPPISNKELLGKSNELFVKYSEISQTADIEWQSIEKAKNERRNKLITEIECSELPQIDKQSEAYLLGNLVKNVERDIPMDYVPISSPAKNLITSKNIKDDLPKIEKLKNLNIDEMSIIQMNDYYQTCLTITRVLPVFVKNLVNSKTQEDIDKAYDYFVFLYNAFKNLQSIDKSIISQTVNEFKESFSSMIGKFKKAGMNIEKYIPHKFVTYNYHNQDFITYPNKDQIFIQKDSWNIPVISKSSNFLLSHTSSINKLQIGHNKAFNENKKVAKNSNKSVQKNNTLAKKTDISKPHEIDINYVLTKKSNNDNDKDKSKESPKEEETKPNKVFFSINKKSIELSNENLDGILSGFSENESIRASIESIKNINEMSNIAETEFKQSSIDPAFFKPPPNIKDKELPIQSLINQSFSLSQDLVIAASNYNIPFSKICVNILVDCSSFISIENKLFNMLLICSLTNALDILLIPYSVAVFGDCNFKQIIKTFEDEHTPFELQKILDCLLIKRLCSNLPSAIKFGIDNMEHKDRKQRAIFTFTSGLDDQIRLTKSWAETIFTQNYLSFLLVFIKSVNLEKEDEKYLSTVWSNFESEINEYGAHSTVKVIPIDAKISSFNSFVDAFVSVMMRNDDGQINETKYFDPLFDANKAFENPMNIQQKINDNNNNQFNGSKCVFYKKTDVLNGVKSQILRINDSIYRNKLCQIIRPLSRRRNDDVVLVIKKFIEKRFKINQSSLETIFKLNKASEAVLSNTGSDFDIIAVIMNLINPVPDPDPYIYLEEKGGWIRHYGVSIIIDTSISCFFNLSSIHTLLTIKTVLSSLAALDLPCFDLILTGNPEPIVLCSEVGTIHGLDQKSSIWEHLFAHLNDPVPKSDLASAINAAYDIKRMRSKDYSSYLFILTDGLYEKSERDRIIEVVNNCALSGTEVIGIGVGTYPKGIENLFPNVVFSPNPSLVMKCIASLLGDIISQNEDKMPTINPAHPEVKDIKQAFDLIKMNENRPIFSDLKRELSKIKHLQDAFRHYSNPEGNTGDAIKGFTNFNGENAEMYKKNIFLGQKILIVMLWEYNMNQKKENEALQPKYIEQNIDPNKNECIKAAVEHFGITIDIVQDYKKAIEMLTNKTKPGYCDYYAVWVMCGPDFPCGRNSNLVGQFIDVLTQFWKNRGSIVFFAEGGHLFYQVNLFLKKNGFNFCIEGNHEGNKILTPEESNDQINIQKFNKHPVFNNVNERKSLAHNLGKIFEGVSVAYAEYDLEKLHPFIPFARDSQGGIISMFLPDDNTNGDIVIDCGYTKCFDSMTEDGTFRYIQNIAGFTMNMESHCLDGFSPREWRPKEVNHLIKLDDEWEYPILKGTEEIDIVFCIDATGSMGKWLNAAKDRTREIAFESKTRNPNYSFRFGVIFYRDPIKDKKDKNEYFQPTDDIDSLVNFMATQKPWGGGNDGPEDWVSAYYILINEINWRPSANRIVIHIADDCAHGKDWGRKNDFPKQNEYLYTLIRSCASLNIFFSGVSIGTNPNKTFEKIRQVYNEEGKSALFSLSPIGNVNVQMAGDFIAQVTFDVISNISAF